MIINKTHKNGIIDMNKKKQAKVIIKEANKIADKYIDEKKINWKAYGLAFAVSGLLIFSLTADASCSYKTNALGNIQYSCGASQSGTLRTDVLGTTRDSMTGTTWRTDVLGTTRSSTGITYRTDVLGTTRGSDGTTWRTDVLGNTRSNTGIVCSKDLLGTVNCR